jgi:acetyl esterase
MVFMKPSGYDSAPTALHSPSSAPDESAPWCDLVLPSCAGRPPVRLRCHCLARASRGVLVWAHGGSWVGGSVESWHEPCAALARASAMAVISVEYRLAPRWPFPAPLEDLMHALQWAAATFAPPSGQPPFLAVGGDSAGATLAASAALRCRDEGPTLAAQILAYPPLDPSCSHLSYRRHPRCYPSRELMLDAWAAYRGPERATAADHPFTPWEVTDLSGLPPAIIGVGENDPVAGDSLVFAERLAEQGTAVSLRSFAGVGHGLFLDQSEDGSFPLQNWIAEHLRSRQRIEPR